MDFNQHRPNHEHWTITRSSSAQPGERTFLARLNADDGEIPTIFVMLTLTMIMFYSMLHFSIVFHGRSAVSAAAQDGLAAAQLKDGTEADGEAALTRTLQLANHVLVTNYDVSIDAANTEVVVTIEGEVQSLFIEDLFDDFSIEVRGPKERFYAEDERP